MTATNAKPNVVRTSIHVDKADLDKLDKIAVRINPVAPSRAAIIRQAIDEFIARQEQS